MKKTLKNLLIGSVAVLAVAATAFGAGSVPNPANYFTKTIHTVKFVDRNDQFGDASNRIPAIFVNTLNSLRGNISADSVSASAVNASTTNSHTVNASTTNSANINATTTNSTNVNATTITAATVTATTINASSVPASAVNGSAITLTPTVTHVTQTYGYTGSVQTWTVPFNVSGSVKVTLHGANGGTSNDGQGFGGYGGYAIATLSPASSSAGTVYHYNVGQAGVLDAAGYGGGGSPGDAGGGGGATWLSATSTCSTSTVIVVAAGGGGATFGSGNASHGGNGGGLTGQNGASYDGYAPGGGGTQSAGGSGGGPGGSAGSACQGGHGSTSGGQGGGGGGGYFGGGGNTGGGGGGSSHFADNLTATSTGALAANGDGSITFDYDVTANDSAIQSNAGGGCLVLGAASGTPSLVYAYFDSAGALYATTTKPSFCQ